LHLKYSQGLEKDKFVWVETENSKSSSEKEIWLRPISSEEYEEVYMIIQTGENLKDPDKIIFVLIGLPNLLFYNYESIVLDEK
jgi:hypothetical protein